MTQKNFYDIFRHKKFICGNIYSEGSIACLIQKNGGN